MSNASIKFAKKKKLAVWRLSISNTSVSLFSKCVLQNLPELDVCKSFIPTVLLGTESFTKTAGWMGLETSWLINNVPLILSTVHNSR